MGNLIKASRKLNNLWLFINILLFQACIAQSNIRKENDLYASIRFEDHFNNDTLDFYLNDEKVVSGAILISNEIYAIGVTDIKIDIYKKDNKYFIITEGSSEKKSIQIRDDELKMKIVLNRVTKLSTIHINKGMYIGIDNDKNNLIITQRSTPPFYD